MKVYIKNKKGKLVDIDKLSAKKIRRILKASTKVKAFGELIATERLYTKKQAKILDKEVALAKLHARRESNRKIAESIADIRLP